MAAQSPAKPVHFDKAVILRRLLGELTGILQDVVGREDSAGFISSVGARAGRWIDAAYRDALGVDVMDPETLAQVLVGLNDSLDAEFELVDVTPERIVIRNRRCPFGSDATGRSSLCSMTSGIFGRIAADNLGYANVVSRKSIARGDACCMIEIHLSPGKVRDRIVGQEYYSTHVDRRRET